MNSHNYYFVRAYIKGERDITFSGTYKGNFRETPDKSFEYMVEDLKKEYPNHNIDVLQFNFLCCQ